MQCSLAVALNAYRIEFRGQGLLVSKKHKLVCGGNEKKIYQIAMAATNCVPRLLTIFHDVVVASNRSLWSELRTLSKKYVCFLPFSDNDVRFVS